MDENKQIMEQDTKNPMLGGCPAIEQAIAAWYEGGQKNVTPVLNTLMEEMKAGAEVIIPVVFPEGFNPAEGSGEEDVEVSIQHLDAGEGKFWFAAFTNYGEVKKGADTSTMIQLLSEFMQLTINAENCEGLVLNPWDQSISLPQKILPSMLDAIREVPQDEQELTLGSIAYNEGDYAKAVEHYTRSAAAGNVMALSNLGYCYYYGRSIPVDKEKARTCWEKAAILGDICAIYKLADMYRSGELPEDPVFTRAMYHKAYALAAEHKDYYSYPDACLRILKYCKDDCSPKVYRRIAEDCAAGFKARVDDGDVFAPKLYEEAMEILKALPAEESAEEA